MCDFNKVRKYMFTLKTYLLLSRT